MLKIHKFIMMLKKSIQNKNPQPKLPLDDTGKPTYGSKTGKRKTLPLACELNCRVTEWQKRGCFFW